MNPEVRIPHRKTPAAADASLHKYPNRAKMVSIEDVAA